MNIAPHYITLMKTATNLYINMKLFTDYLKSKYLKLLTSMPVLYAIYHIYYKSLLTFHFSINGASKISTSEWRMYDVRFAMTWSRHASAQDNNNNKKNTFLLF